MHGEILMLALVLAAALAGGKLATRFGYPSILGEIIAGILLGPPVVGLLERNEATDVLGEFGILLMMLYIGMHLDVGDLRRASRPGLLAAAGGFLVPTALGIGTMLLVGRSFLEAIFVGLAMGVTSLATKSRILVDLKILDTRVAHVLVAGALLSDVAVLVVFAAVVGSGGSAVGMAGVAALKAVGFGFGAWVIGTRGLPALVRRAGARDLDRNALLVGVIVFGLGFAWAAELAGIHAILGAFVAGLFLDDGVIDRKLSRDVQQKLSTMSVGVLAPFFFVSAGFEVSLEVFRTDLALLLAVIVLATLGKVLGTTLFYLPTGHGWREGLVVGAGMNGRGAVEIIVAELALAQGLIGRDVFSILVFMALSTTATVPILLTLGVRWLRGRGELVKAGDRTRAVIVGAGPVARTMGRTLQESMPVVHLDTNRTNQTAGRREGLTILAGSGMDQLALEEAGVDKALRVIAATPNAEVNVLTAQLAVDLGVPEVAVMMRDSDIRTLSNRLAETDIDIIRIPEDFSGWEHALSIGKARAESVDVAQDLDRSARPGPPWPPDPASFPLSVVNSGERFPFVSLEELSPGDRVVLLRWPGVEAFPDRARLAPV